MPRKFVTHCIISIVVIAFINEAHRLLVVNLFLKSASKCHFGELDEMRLLQKWEVNMSILRNLNVHEYFRYININRL